MSLFFWKKSLTNSHGKLVNIIVRSEICKYSGIQDWSEDVKWDLGKDTKKWANAMTAQGDSDDMFKWKRVEEKEWWMGIGPLSRERRGLNLKAIHVKSQASLNQ